jgi:hypothetical protein
MNNILKTNSFAILLILILLGLNTYVLIQYVSVNKELKQLKNPSGESVGVPASVVLTEFLDVVLNTRKTTPDDRIKLESDIRQLGDKEIIAEWEAFLASKDTKISQAKVIKIIGLLEDKMTK